MGIGRREKLRELTTDRLKTKRLVGLKNWEGELVRRTFPPANTLGQLRDYIREVNDLDPTILLRDR